MPTEEGGPPAIFRWQLSDFPVTKFWSSRVVADSTSLKPSYHVEMAAAANTPPSAGRRCTSFIHPHDRVLD